MEGGGSAGGELPARCLHGFAGFRCRGRGHKCGVWEPTAPDLMSNLAQATALQLNLLQRALQQTDIASHAGAVQLPLQLPLHASKQGLHGASA